MRLWPAIVLVLVGCSVPDVANVRSAKGDCVGDCADTGRDSGADDTGADDTGADLIDMSLADADVELWGEVAGDGAGEPVAAAGDVNADGIDDVLVGARRNDDGGVDAGAVYLVLGSPDLASETLSLADAEYSGEHASDFAGSAAGVGDVDGDGYDDILLGAYQNGDAGELSGAAYLLLGSASPSSRSLAAADAIFTGEGAFDEAGLSVSGAGDVNGDGRADLLIGASLNRDEGYQAGAAYLVLGADRVVSSSLAGASAIYTGVADSDQTGFSAASAGDVNADGLDDLLIGATPSLTNFKPGFVDLVLGSTEPMSASLSTASARFTGEAVGDSAGAAVAGVGDVNGDGYGDFLVGAYTCSEGALYAGRAYLQFGAVNLTSGTLAVAGALYTGTLEREYVGVAVSGAGDVNCDGFADMLIGASGNVDGGVAAGAGWLILGSVAPESGWIAESGIEFTGRPGDIAGISVASGGDINGDGNPDLLFGGYQGSEAAPTAGVTYVVFGRGVRQ